jgi:hypothetical protein
MKDRRIVVTLTTLPGRYDILEKTLKSITEQTIKIDTIYLTLPKICKRLQQPYPPLPDSIKNICTLVEPQQDYGPICKIYGALTQETNPSTLIFSCDDDVIYPPTLFEEMLKCLNKQPESVICGTGALIGKGLLFYSNITNLQNCKKWNGFIGFSVPEQGRKIDLVFGVTGVLYQRNHFADDLTELWEHSLADSSLFCNDDIVISGYLSSRGIDRYVFYDLPGVISSPCSSDALSFNVPSMVLRMHKAIKIAEERGLFQTYEHGNYSETIFWKTVIIIIVLILIFFVIYFAIKN